MNMWGFKPGLFAHLKDGFTRFLDARGTELKAEYYLPEAVDRLIAETQGNLDRGYAYETITVYEDYWTTCPEPPVVEGEPAPKPRMCLDERPVTEQRAKAIDLNEEARKLDSLNAKRRDLARKAEDVIAHCKAQYPE